MQHRIISNARQGSLGLFMPKPMATGEFRESCSLWIDEARIAAGLSLDLASGIFNHVADGRPRHDLSPFRFATEGNWGLVHAVGDEAVGILKRLADAATMGVARLPAAFAAPRWEDRNVGIVLDGTDVWYWLPEMIVCRNAEQHVRWNKSNTAEKSAHVQDLITRALKRQMNMLGFRLTLPVVSVREIKRERAIPKLRKVQANAYVRVASIAFTMSATLHGHWAAGALINRGYGAILAPIKHSDVRTSGNYGG